MRRATVTALVLATGAVLALAAPHARPRRDARWTSVTARAAVTGDGAVAVHVRVRNTNTKRRRIFVRGLDLAESLVPAGGHARVEDLEMERLPIAPVHRVPLRREIAAGRWADFTIRIENVEPGHHAGYVDVLVDGSRWVRAEVAYDVGA